MILALAAAAYLSASLGLLLFLISEGFAADAEHLPVEWHELLALSLAWPAVAWSLREGMR